jgi:hypothetical protein
MPAKNPDLHGSAPDNAPTCAISISWCHRIAWRRSSGEHTRQALAHMRRVLKADLTLSTALDLSRAA